VVDLGDIIGAARRLLMTGRGIVDAEELVQNLPGV